MPWHCEDCNWSGNEQEIATNETYEPSEYFGQRECARVCFMVCPVCDSDQLTQIHLHHDRANHGDITA